MTVEDVIETIENEHNGAWYMLFHTVEGGYKFLPTGHVLTSGAYLAVVRHIAGEEPAPVLSAEDRKRNTLQAKAQGKGEEYG